MLDEAQDTNPVLADVLMVHSKNKWAQIIAVGDSQQQIYEWRGAVDAMSLLPAKNECALTNSFRFGAEIARVANRTLDVLGSKYKVVGAGSDPGRSVILAASPNLDEEERAPIEQLDAILCRGNTTVVRQICAAHEAKRMVAIPNGVATDLERLLRDVDQLKCGKPAKSPELIGYADWEEVEKITSRPHAADLRVLVALVKNYGVLHLQNMVAKCLACKSPHDAPPTALYITTIHKAKGCEWGRVWVTSDINPRPVFSEEFGTFVDPKPEPELLRLRYVAFTRPKSVLYYHEPLTCDQMQAAAFSNRKENDGY